MNGFLLVNKPAGMSSFGVVSRVRKIVSAKTGKKSKVGHAGTLDPFATGLLILMIGKATKQAGEFLKFDKSYEAKVILGAESTTADPEGQITYNNDTKPSINDINEALAELSGDIQQIPPAFSAIKVNGRRAYDLARKGVEIEMKPRSVKIYGYKNIKYNYPELSFNVKVGSGTYIRSLAVDIGNKLGTGAYLKELNRGSIGGYTLKNAHSLESISPENIEGMVIIN